MESKSKKKKRGDRFWFIGCLGFFILYSVTFSLGVGIHIASTMIAANYYNVAAATVTFFLPFFAEFYWFYIVYSTAGVMNPYCILTLVWVCVFLCTVASIGKLDKWL